MSIVESDEKNDREKILSKQDVLRIAQIISSDPKVEVVNYNIEDYSSVKLGYSGVHSNLTIKIQKENAKEPENVSFFVKSFPYGNQVQADHLNADRIFIKEFSFYDKIFPWLTEEYQGEKWSATSYLAKQDVIVMEDLRSEGYSLLADMFDNPKPLESALTTLARFHSCSIITQARLIKQSKSPRLNEYYPDLLNEIIFKKGSKSAKMCSAGANVAASIAERLGFNSTNLRRSYERIYEIVKPSKTHRNVIGHGDLWSNNIMFDNSTPIRKCVLVDFPTIRYTPLVLDILHLLYLNSTKTFRKQHEDELLEIYHSILEETVQSYDSTGNADIPSFNEIKNDFEDLRVYGPVLASLYFPMAFLGPEILKECTSSAEKYENFLFVDRTEIVLGHMDKNEAYRNRIEETITELAEISEKAQIPIELNR